MPQTHARKRTTAEVRRAIQRSRASIRVVARRYGVNPKTVAKWRRRASIVDGRSGPRQRRSTVLTPVQEAVIVALRRCLPLGLDRSLAALRVLVPALTRSSLHRCLQRHGLSQPPATARSRTGQTACFELRLLEIRAGALRCCTCVAVERASGFVFARLYEAAAVRAQAGFVRDLSAAMPGSVVVPGPGWSGSALERSDQAIAAAVAGLRAVDIAGLRQQLARWVAALNRNRVPAAAVSRTPGMRDVQPALPQRDAQARRTAGTTVPRSRDPDATREAILRAARRRLAHDGPEGLSLSEVAREAGVNRGTAYLHFNTREELIAATADWVSDRLYAAVFADSETYAPSDLGRVDVASLTERLATFAMDNPELCRIWLLKVLSSPDPSKDRFWREYRDATLRFAGTPMSQADVDTEVLSVVTLAGAFLWPVWARAQTARPEELRRLAQRYVQECLRVSMYGNLRSGRYPEIARRLGRQPGRAR